VQISNVGLQRRVKVGVRLIKRGEGPVLFSKRRGERRSRKDEGLKLGRKTQRECATFGLAEGGFVEKKRASPEGSNRNTARTTPAGSAKKKAPKKKSHKGPTEGFSLRTPGSGRAKTAENARRKHLGGKVLGLDRVQKLQRGVQKT